LHSSSRRSAWNSKVERIARSRLLLSVPASGAASSLRAWWSPSAGALPSAAARLNRVVGDRVSLAEIADQRRHSGGPVPHRAAAEAAADQVVAPGDGVRAGDGPEFLRLGNAGEAHEPAPAVSQARRVCGLVRLANHSTAGGTSASRRNSSCVSSRPAGSSARAIVAGREAAGAGIGGGLAPVGTSRVEA
jgi:hypothetical protein